MVIIKLLEGVTSLHTLCSVAGCRTHRPAAIHSSSSWSSRSTILELSLPEGDRNVGVDSGTLRPTDEGAWTGQKSQTHFRNQMTQRSRRWITPLLGQTSATSSSSLSHCSHGHFLVAVFNQSRLWLMRSQPSGCCNKTTWRGADTVAASLIPASCLSRWAAEASRLRLVKHQHLYNKPQVSFQNWSFELLLFLKLLEVF